jgi:hypothetical protein
VNSSGLGFCQRFSLTPALSTFVEREKDKLYYVMKDSPLHECREGPG